MTGRGPREAPVEVARFSFRYQAEMALGILEDEGIPGVVVADDVGGMYTGIAAARIAVPAEHADRARRVLAEMERDVQEADGEEPAGEDDAP